MAATLRKHGAALGVFVVFVVTTVVVALAGSRVHQLQNDETISVNGGTWLSRHFPTGLFDWSHISGRGFERLAAYVSALGHAVAPDAASAFPIQHWLMAAVWASAVVWTFLLAREIGVGNLAAIAAGAMAVLVPWRVLGTSFLNSTPAYATVPLAAWLVLRAVQRPSFLRDLLALGGLLLVALARTGNLLVAFILPVAMLAGALALRAPGEGPVTALRRIPRRHPVITAAVLGALVIYVLVGAQKVVSGYSVHGTTWSFFWGRLKVVVAQLSQGLFILPTAIGGAWIVMTALRRRAAPAPRTFAWIAIAALLALAYASSLAGAEERYVAPVAPLLVVAFVAAVERREVGLISASVAVLLVARAIAIQPPLTDPGPYGFFASAGQTAFTRLILGRASVDLPVGGHHVLLLITIASLALIAALALVRREPLRRGLAAGAIAIPFVWCAITGAYITKKFVDGAGVPTVSWEQLTFVDRVAGDRFVGALEYDPTFAGQMQPIWREITAFNRQIQETVGYGYDGTLVCCGFDIRVARVWGDPDTGRLRTFGRIPRLLAWIPRYVPFGLDTDVVGGETYLPIPAQVLRLHGKPRIAFTIRGPSKTGDIAQNQRVRFRVFALPGRPRATCLAIRVAAAQGYVGTPPRRYELRWPGGDRRGALITAYNTIMVPLDVRGRYTDVSLVVRSREHLAPSQPIATLAATDRVNCPARAR